MTSEQSSLSEPDRRGLGWRLLAFFWISLLVFGTVGAGWLQYLGPMTHPVVRRIESEGTGSERKAPPAMNRLAEIDAGQDKAAATAPTLVLPPPVAKPVSQAPDVVVEPKATVPPASAPVFVRPGTPIAAPIPALLEPPLGADKPGALEPATPEAPLGFTIAGGAGLPRVVQGMKPSMQVYAGGFDPQDRRPRIGLLLSGIGLSEPDSDDAIRLLPPAVTLAVSPYSIDPQPLLQRARARGHELLVSIPMEAQGFPLNDEGPHALLTGASLSDMMDNLHWALSRFAGYAGATGALDGMRGERFAASDVLMAKALDDITRRGLLYVDPRAGEKVAANEHVRGVDLVIDEPPVRTEISLKLANLEKMAKDRGQVLGLAGMPRPVTIAQIAVWAAQLNARGFVLVPVTALFTPPPPAQPPVPPAAPAPVSVLPK